METVNNDLFYTRLPVNEIPLGELLMEEHLFYSMPRNWYVVITDVKNSTAAVKEGFYQTINLVATGSIVAALNGRAFCCAGIPCYVSRQLKLKLCNVDELYSVSRIWARANASKYRTRMTRIGRIR